MSASEGKVYKEDERYLGFKLKKGHVTSLACNGSESGPDEEFGKKLVQTWMIYISVCVWSI